MIESGSALENLHRSSTSSGSSTDQILCKGYMEMYPSLIDSSIGIEKWIDANKAKKRFFSLNLMSGQSYCRLEYKRDEDPQSKYEGVFFIEFCTALRQSSTIKPNSFQMYINDKILFFVCPTAEEFSRWVKCISDASGILPEQSVSQKQQNMKRATNIQETWERSGIPSIVEFAKENDVNNQKLRKEVRYRLFDVYQDIIDFVDTHPQEKSSVYVPGDVFGERILFEYQGIKFNINYIEPFILSFAVYDIKTGTKLTEDFHCDPIDPSLANLLKNYTPAEQYCDVILNNQKALLNSSSMRCIISIPSPSDDLYIVAKFYKMYTSNLNKLWDMYSKSGPKNESELGKQLKKCCEKVKKYCMPIGFSYKKLFNQSILDRDSQFSPLMKYVFGS